MNLFQYDKCIQKLQPCQRKLQELVNTQPTIQSTMPVKQFLRRISAMLSYISNRKKRVKQRSEKFSSVKATFSLMAPPMASNIQSQCKPQQKNSTLGQINQVVLSKDANHQQKNSNKQKCVSQKEQLQGSGHSDTKAKTSTETGETVVFSNNQTVNP